jgi:putative transposase
VVQYRRNFVPGGTYFFTVVLHDRQANTLVRHIEILRQSFSRVKATRPFQLDAIVVLPDHLHALWTLPVGDADFSGRWRAIKAAFVRGAAAAGETVIRNARGEAEVWQRRFWEHTIRDEADFAAHCDYIHFNPVKHGLAACPADWLHSSIHRFIERGIYPPDWTVSDSPDDARRNPGSFGERA